MCLMYEQEIPKGWVTGPPDFVGVGAQRSGTSWWFNLISDHPEVKTTERSHKEVHFFGALFARSLEERDIRAYHAAFPRPPGLIVGEWTPRYMFDPWTPPMLARAAPDVQLLVMLRDPVERYRSGLGRHETSLREAGRGPPSADVASNALLRGLYFMQLQHLLRHFDRSRLLVLQYERCHRDPYAELERTYRFLGLGDSGHAPATIHEHVERLYPHAELDPEARSRFSAFFAEDVSRLAASFPEIDTRLWPNFRDLAATRV